MISNSYLYGMKPFRLLFLFLAVTFIACENDLQTVKNITAKETLPDESASDVELIYSDSARIKVKLNAKQLDRYSTSRDPYIEMKNGVSLNFYDDSMRVKTRLTAKYAIRKENSSIMEAKDKVVVVNELGQKLETEHLIWDENTRKIYTNTFVKITTEDKIFMGDGMVANDDFTGWKITNSSGIINVDDAENE